MPSHQKQPPLVRPAPPPPPPAPKRAVAWKIPELGYYERDRVTAAIRKDQGYEVIPIYDLGD